ncbi:acetate--CoA ligase family protein [Sulfitobacter dubius]|uniref:Protein lysine acetyltransferase Pka n=1 Tax=Sulfitobacter dubius TaxID=218673 RepID=A0ABY3ZRE5_9RHOB|nr:acetate--CoA ligase family protein [Sulfitobacter dubius]UOA17192.1 Protein lysine acetyltransferase Pka [Sulfitobacter dubius]
MSLAKLLSPKSVAIVGVSSKAATFQVGGRAVFEHLVKHGYQGRIDLITRAPIALHGVASIGSLAELSNPPDCLVLSVPAAQVVALIEEALTMGVRAFVTISAGFSESGPEGSALQDRIAKMLAAHGAVMLGPNTTGYVNFTDKVAMSSTSRITSHLPPTGRIGAIVQSGALGSALMDVAERDGIGLSQLISTGNEAVTDVADFVEFLVDDPATDAIVLYVEAFRHPERILRAARRAFAAGKPIAIYKAGKSETGRAAAAGHTGALLGTRGTYEAAARQLGLTDVRNLEDLLPVADYIRRAKGGRSVGVLTVSGGLGGAVADTLAAAGDTALPKPGAATAEALSGYLPEFLKPQNPVDVGGSPFRDEGGFKACLSSFAADPAFEAVVVASTPVVPKWAGDMVAAIKSVSEKTGKTISAVWPAEVFNAEGIADLRRAGFASFTRVETAVASLNGAAAWWTRRAEPGRLLAEGAAGSVGAVPEATRSMDEATSKKILKGHGISFLREVFVPVSDMADAPRIAKDVGYPVTIKGIATDVIHKSEYGLVSVGLEDEAALSATLDAMCISAETHKLDLHGFILAETLQAKAEVFVGISHDREFGPTLTVGSGGIYTEVHQDVVTRLLPVSETEIEAMFDNCRIGKILRGTRGKPALDMPALVAMVTQLCVLAEDPASGLAGIELNPIGVGVEGEGAWIFDATVFVAEEAK